ncbi:P-selectin glycoprotein ligand 1 isoform X2 [Zootoca vivipara]|uniref:P-selectin glycoprotein ligand 1 isoform X2 n=1 Tax=Zootoca vivipara TaxID=8524 RepID=UPI00293B9226|nr:P-selectin glycoprotein ligand 1 isoform X2 [Zootoca vivipara]
MALLLPSILNQESLVAAILRCKVEGGEGFETFGQIICVFGSLSPPTPGKMAPFWLSLWMVLWSLLTAGSFRLPTLRLLIQDGAAGSQSASPEKWMWKRAGDDGQESPRLPCGKTDGSCKHPAAATAEQAKKSLTVTEAESSTSVGKTYNGATAEVPTNATTTLDTFGKVSTEVGTTKEVIHLSTTKSSRAPVARVRRLAPTVGATTSQSMPNETEKVATALQETMMVLAVPKKLLVGATSSQSMVASSDVSTAKLRQAVGTTGPSFIAKGKVKFPHSTAKPSPATDWLLLDDMTSSMVASSDVSTAKLRQAVGTTGPSFIAKGKVNFPHSTAKPSSTTDWLLLDDVTSSQSRVASSDVSTAKLRQAVGTTGPSFIAKGKVKFPHSTAMPSPATDWLLLDDMTSSMVANSDVSTAKLRQAVGTTGPSFIAKVAISATITTAKVKPPSVTSLGGATILVGKCLLWIFILALIAGIFIVATGVLATMLWRQKRAYKMNGRNHTEMVCISSLLAAEEAEEAGGRHPRGKRVKMLGANGSEADMDNLTLNSFLPEH